MQRVKIDFLNCDAENVVLQIDAFKILKRFETEIDFVTNAVFRIISGFVKSGLAFLDLKTFFS